MRLAARVSAISAAVYVAILVVDPLLERKIDVLTVHPEDYAEGAFGLLVNLSYGAFAVALAALAAVLFREGRRTVVAVAPLVPPAILCAALALAPPAVARSGSWVSFAILGLAFGPLVVEIALRKRLRRLHRVRLGVAIAVVLAFGALVATPTNAGGLVNRIFDVLAGTWVILAAPAAEEA